MIGTFGNMSNEMPKPQNELLSTLIYYCRLAVQAVEQLVKSGQIDKDDEARRDIAMEMVEQYATADGVTLDDNSRETVKSLIEVQVYQMRKEKEASVL